MYAHVAITKLKLIDRSKKFARSLCKVLKNEKALATVLEGEEAGALVLKAGGPISEAIISGETKRVNPLKGTRYTDKVLGDMKRGDYHSFPNIVDNFGGLGKVRNIVGGDGVMRTKVEISGAYRGKSGIFEYIIESDGYINHRLFKPN